MKWLAQFIESPNGVTGNARCLTEGVDVSGIDTVVFAAPKQSTVDIVQASARALRRAEGKEFGYIFIPIIMPDDMPFDAFAETTQLRRSSKFCPPCRRRTIGSSRHLPARFYGPNPARGGKHRERITKIGGEMPIGLQIPLDEFAFYTETRLWDRVRFGEWRDYDDVVKIVRETGIQSRAGRAW